VGTPREDSVRRDFTINALFFNLITSKLEDFTTGIEDLSNGFLRTLVDPFVSFGEDPLRMLRACRFAARFRLNVDEKIVEAANASLEVFATKIARPRMEKEISGGLSKNPDVSVELYVRCGIFRHIFDPFGMWELDLPGVLTRVKFAAERAEKVQEKYGLTLAAIYAPLLEGAPVEDPANRKKRIHPIECAIARHLCAPLATAQIALRLLNSAATVREIKNGEIRRLIVGRWLREIGAVWRATECLLFDDADLRFFVDVIVVFVEKEALEGVWGWKPLMSGAELARFHNVRPGKEVAKLVAELIDWQIEHPGATVDDFRRTAR
jgi:tRNA nucleotidyltransferase (CCA-adding enzyme)